MSETETEAVAALAEQAAREVSIENIKSVPFIFMPEGMEMHERKDLMAAPIRARGMYEVHDLDSLVRLWKRYVNESTYVLITPPWNHGDALASDCHAPRFTAIFNGNQRPTGDAQLIRGGWEDFGADYKVPFSPEWRLWAKASGHRFTQAEFADFIEDNGIDIQQREEKDKDGNPTFDGPSASEMLSLARSMQARKSVEFTGVVNNTDGSGLLHYDEQVKGTTQGGQVSMPEAFYIAIPVFDRGKVYRLRARLRYRIPEGKLRIGYDLFRPHKTLEHAYHEQIVELGKVIPPEATFVATQP